MTDFEQKFLEELNKLEKNISMLHSLNVSKDYIVNEDALEKIISIAQDIYKVNHNEKFKQIIEIANQIKNNKLNQQDVYELIGGEEVLHTDMKEPQKIAANTVRQEDLQNANEIQKLIKSCTEQEIKGKEAIFLKMQNASKQLRTFDFIGFDLEVDRLIRNTLKSISQDSFTSRTYEAKYKTCYAFNDCFRLLHEAIKEKQQEIINAKKLSINKSQFEKKEDALLQSTTQENPPSKYNVKYILEHGKEFANNDFLPITIKMLEIIGNSAVAWQKNGHIKDDTAFSLVCSTYTIAKNLTDILEKDEKAKNFYNTHELRISNLGDQDKRSFSEFARDQYDNYDYAQSKKRQYSEAISSEAQEPESKKQKTLER